MSFKRIFLILVIVCVGLIGCSAQSNEDQMTSTTERILKIIEKGDEEGFQDKIGVRLGMIGKDKESIHFDFQKIMKLYRRHLLGKKPRIIVTNEYNEAGNRKVIVPFVLGENPGATSEIRLELYFGPPRFVPLNKIAKYKMVTNIPIAPSVVAPVN